MCEKIYRVEDYIGLVKRIALALVSRLPPSVEVDDLIQNGSIGLMKAVKKFDPLEGTSFEVYAGIRIRGEMLDGLRKEQLAPRSYGKFTRSIEEASRCVENRTFTPASAQEISGEMGISLDKYFEKLNKIDKCAVVFFEDVHESFDPDPSRPVEEVIGDPLHVSILDIFEIEEIADVKNRVLESLDFKRRIIWDLYYVNGLTQKEIGLMYGTSESAVSSLLSRVLNKIKREWEDNCA